MSAASKARRPAESFPHEVAALGGPPLLVPTPHTGEPACSSFERSCTASLDMKGYHDLVDHGRREIYKIES